MAKGPKGEYRPTDPLKAGMLVMRIAVGDLTEEQARKTAKKPKRRSKRPAKGAPARRK